MGTWIYNPAGRKEKNDGRDRSEDEETKARGPVIDHVTANHVQHRKKATHASAGSSSGSNKIEHSSLELEPAAAQMGLLEQRGETATDLGKRAAPRGPVSAVSAAHVVSASVSASTLVVRSCFVAIVLALAAVSL